MLDVVQKLEILSDAAKYDVSCSSSGLDRPGKKGSIGSAAAAGICHSWTEDGRCISLLKVLMSNACVYDCAYCINRKSNDRPRATFTPREIADLTIEFYKRNYIEGLFISSAVIGSPNYTTELFIKALTILRQEHHFRGYIHAKVIPAADPALTHQLGLLADRVSVNIEFATKTNLALLAADKNHRDILTPMQYIADQRQQNTDERKHFSSAPKFVPAGQSTQLIVGAGGERDILLLKLSEGLYQRYGLKRVYYSAYIPVMTHPSLPAITTKPPLLREHRLYQADWLLRFYGFTVKEIVNEKTPDLDLEVDPKIHYALQNPHLFPVEVNRADYQMLLRVPGIGVTSAKRILEARRFGSIDEAGLKKIGVVLKRAKYFLTVKGRFLGNCQPDNPLLREILKDSNSFAQTTLYQPYTSFGQAEPQSSYPESKPLTSPLLQLV